MTACPALPASGLSAVNDTLRLIDCRSNALVSDSFARLFGINGALGPALTLLLTLFVGLFALALLMGRTSLRLTSLTPRILHLGLVLTFATSWLAYHDVFWSLLTGAPDELAGIMIGTKGSATSLFASRMDAVFSVLAQSAQQAATLNLAAANGTPPPSIAGHAANPVDLLWLGAMMLLLGTVGVLIVTRIALAIVVALGPVFIILSLFRGTQGLFEGWLKAAVMLALTPLMAVLLGAGTLAMLAPMVNTLAHADGQVPLDLATSIFMAAFVYLALMLLGTRTAMVIVNGWHIIPQTTGERSLTPAFSDPFTLPASASFTPAPASMPGENRTADLLRGIPATSFISNAPEAVGPGGVVETIRAQRSLIVAAGLDRGAAAMDSAPAAMARDPRIRPLGQGYRRPAPRRAGR
ncbi:MAG: type IV secretion system protein [Alphaproteobacteria bacterium]|nr:type IV secretion system protein [Alphaproteobacteria bacterium]MDE2041925.1 type IV secretion system protein [Alphaproteobacteria bacterium]MDE2340408.1 type IV secretion system protein [Alphaproteobacteria bacterium]